MRKLIVLGVLMLVQMAASADALSSVWFDAAAYDWRGVGLYEQRALVVVDNRSGKVPAFCGEVAMTSAAWSETTMSAALWASPWNDCIDASPAAEVAGKRWTMATEWFTAGSRPYPTCRPVAFWESVEVDEFGVPLASGSMAGYVAPGGYWVACPSTTGAFFHSPATCAVGADDYSDADRNPTFTGLPEVPEPSIALLLAAGLAAIRRRRAGR